MSFNKKVFLDLLGTNTFIHDIQWYDELKSSQDVIKSIVSETNDTYILIGADEMSEARGQYTRKFITSKGNGLYFSLAIPRTSISNIKQHTKLLMGVSIAKAIKVVANLKVKIKFPNDINFENKKLCGVLVEEFKVSQSNKYLIIGVGLNVNEPKFPSAIENKATSIRIATGFTIARELLCAEIIKQFTVDYRKYQKNGMDYIREEFSNHGAHNFVGKLQDGELIKCEFVDLTDKGYLIVYSEEKQQHYTFYFSDLIQINNF